MKISYESIDTSNVSDYSRMPEIKTIVVDTNTIAELIAVIPAHEDCTPKDKALSSASTIHEVALYMVVELGLNNVEILETGPILVAETPAEPTPDQCCGNSCGCHEEPPQNQETTPEILETGNTVTADITYLYVNQI